LNSCLQRYRDGLLVTGLLLLILGLRIFIGNAFVPELPLVDDYDNFAWLQAWAQGVHNWGFIVVRYNGHPMELYKLAVLAQYLLNGYWDAHLDFLVSSLVHTFYAAVVILTFWDVLPPRHRRWLLLFIFALFAIPFAGYRISWGFLWPHAAGMAFSLAALYYSAYRGQTWSGVIFATLCALLAAMNNGAGCLGAFMVTASVLFRSALARRMSPQDIISSVVCLAIFLSFYLAMGGSGHVPFGEALNAMLKTLGWPVVFVPFLGFITLVPLLGLALAQVFHPAFRKSSADYIVAAGGLVFLISLATGAFRGDNNNAGMPSGRYFDLCMMIPLICVVSLYLLYQGSTGGRQRAWLLFSYVWLCLQIAGFSIHIFFRVIPFLTAQSGEWPGAQYQTLFRNMTHGDTIESASPIATYEKLDLPPNIVDIAAGREPWRAMTLPMVTGFSLQPGAQGDYRLNAYPPPYHAKPSKIFWGSFELGKDGRSQSYRSGPFTPTAPYLTFDLLVDDHEKLSNYRLEGLHLVVADETTGEKTEVLPSLAHTYPFVFRDTEEVYAKVTPGHEYRIESSTSSKNGWLAFSEPYESGRLTPFIVGFSQSGKLICILGLGFLLLVLAVDWMKPETAAPPIA